MGDFRHLDQWELDRLSDDELLEYVRKARAAGEGDAVRLGVQILVWGHLDRVAAFLGPRMPKEEVDEVALQVLESAIKSAFTSPFTGETGEEFRAWLFRIARRRRADYFRKGRLETTSLERREEEAGFEPTVDDDADVVGLDDAIDRVLDRLSPIHRQVVMLHVFDGHPAAEASEEANARHPGHNPAMSESNVHQIASRFRKDLRRELESGQDSGSR